MGGGGYLLVSIVSITFWKGIRNRRNVLETNIITALCQLCNYNNKNRLLLQTLQHELLRSSKRLTEKFPANIYLEKNILRSIPIFKIHEFESKHASEILQTCL